MTAIPINVLGSEFVTTNAMRFSVASAAPSAAIGNTVDGFGVTDRRNQRVFERPVSIKAPAQCFRTHPHFVSPLCDRFLFTLVSQPVTYPRIAHLLALVAPLTIPGFVIAIVIYAIKAHAFRLNAHIGQEIFKTVFPSVTNRDSAAAVMAIVFIVFVKATTLHSHKGIVSPTVGKPCDRVGFRHNTRKSAFSGFLTLQTAARLDFAGG